MGSIRDDDDDDDDDPSNVLMARGSLPQPGSIIGRAYRGARRRGHRRQLPLLLNRVNWLDWNQKIGPQFSRLSDDDPTGVRRRRRCSDGHLKTIFLHYLVLKLHSVVDCRAACKTR